jgi:hypothetical protein
MTQSQRIKLSARIPADLYFRFEDLRSRRSRESGHRLSTRALVQLALERLLQESAL